MIRRSYRHSQGPTVKSETRKSSKTKVALACIGSIALASIAIFSLCSCLAGKGVHKPRIANLSVHVTGVETLPDAEQSVLRVMTLNVAHGRKDRRHQVLQSEKSLRANLDDVAAVLRREKPELVALQEADGPSAWTGEFDHVRYLAEKSGYAYSVRADHVKREKLHYGTGFLSMLPLEDGVAVTFDRTPPTPTKGFVLCTIEWPGCSGTEIDVVSVHLDFSRRSTRQRQIEEIVRTLAGRERPLIVMGDFNCEWTSKDSALRELGEKLNLMAYRPEVPDMDTFPKLKKRFDWIAISRELEYVTYGVLHDAVSDHLAVVCELRMADKTK